MIIRPEDHIYEGFHFMVTRDGDAVVTDYTGPEDADYITVPSVIKGRTVVGIGADAFSGMKKLNTVILPDSITVIGENAFKCCTALENIHLPETLKEIRSCAFQGCSRLEEIKLPISTEIVRIGAFMDCILLHTIWMPKLSTLEPLAFSGCKSLSGIEPDMINPAISYGKDSFSLNIRYPYYIL